MNGIHSYLNNGFLDYRAWDGYLWWIVIVGAIWLADRIFRWGLGRIDDLQRPVPRHSARRPVTVHVPGRRAPMPDPGTRPSHEARQQWAGPEVGSKLDRDSKHSHPYAHQDQTGQRDADIFPLPQYPSVPGQPAGERQGHTPGLLPAAGAQPGTEEDGHGRITPPPPVTVPDLPVPARGISQMTAGTGACRHGGPAEDCWPYSSRCLFRVVGDPVPPVMTFAVASPCPVCSQVLCGGHDDGDREFGRPEITEGEHRGSGFLPAEPLRVPSGGLVSREPATNPRGLPAASLADGPADAGDRGQLSGDAPGEGAERDRRAAEQVKLGLIERSLLPGGRLNQIVSDLIHHDRLMALSSIVASPSDERMLDTGQFDAVTALASSGGAA